MTLNKTLSKGGLLSIGILLVSTGYDLLSDEIAMGLNELNLSVVLGLVLLCLGLMAVVGRESAKKKLGYSDAEVAELKRRLDALEDSETSDK